jgi:hypothetical protein
MNALTGRVREATTESGGYGGYVKLYTTRWMVSPLILVTLPADPAGASQTMSDDVFFLFFLEWTSSSARTFVVRPGPELPVNTPVVLAAAHADHVLLGCTAPAWWIPW